MGGANTKPTRQVESQQQALMGQETGFGTQDRSKMMDIINPLTASYTEESKLSQPSIDFAKGLTSGDPSKVTEAAAPILRQITQQYGGARENIMNETPRGAARDFSLQQLDVQKGDATAKAMADPVMQGFQTLLGLGEGAKGALGNLASGLGSFSLSETGAGLRAGEGAQASNQSIMEAQSAKHAATMGFLGDLVGGASKAKAFSSDRRLKTNIRPLPRHPNLLSLIARVQAVMFDWKDGHLNGDIGVIAQDLQRVFPTLVTVGPGGMYQVNYAALAAIAIAAANELAGRVAHLERKMTYAEQDAGLVQ